MSFHLTDKQVVTNVMLGGSQRHMMLVGGSRCVSGDTVLDGQESTMASLAAIGRPVWVTTTHGRQLAEAPFWKGRCRMLSVHLLPGRQVTVTPDHRFWDGNDWITAESLEIGGLVAVRSSGPSRPVCHGNSSCVPLRSGYALERVSAIEVTAEMDYYTIHVPQTEQYFANGILHHNSGKTFLIVRAILMRAASAGGSRHAILRFRYNAARRSIWLDTLPKVASLCLPDLKLEFRESDGFVRLPNGSEIWVGGLDDKERVERILGQEYASIFFNECSQIAYYSVTTALTRLAQKCTRKVDSEPDSELINRAYYDLNPTGTGHWTYRLFVEGKSPESMATLAHPENYTYTYLNPNDNAENVDREYIESLRALPERQRKRFFEGKYVASLDGALWTFESIEAGRISIEDMPPLKRVVVAVDPSGASGEFDIKADEIGIVVAGIDANNNGYVLDDYTGLYSPEHWARVTANAYHKWSADRVVGERNFGGDMVRAVLHGADRSLPYREVTASRGKAVRAEPIAAYYERNCVHHVGRFPRLEDEMTNFTNAGYLGAGSPNRCLVAGTMIETGRGPVAIEALQRTDLVWTRAGLRTITGHGLTSLAAAVHRLKLSNGAELVGTANHPVFVYGRGFVPMSELTIGDGAVESVVDAGTAPVYNLSVDGEHEYFANGILVHNCDALVWALSDLMGANASFGFIDHMKETSMEVTKPPELPETDAKLGQTADKVAIPRELMKPALGDETLRCPKCESIAIARIPGTGYRCSQCGEQFGAPKSSLPTIGRNEMLRKGA